MKKHLLSFSVAVLCLLSANIFAEQMPSGYYDAINGTQDSILKGTLKTIIRNHTVIPYGSGTNSSWEVFYYSDRNEEGYIMDMYCDDWKIVTTPGQVAAGCNIEHSFAKSWWGGAKNDAYKDCYHLNPSNSTANSSRSNYPLGVPVKDIKSNTGSLKVGKIHHDALNVDFYVFEPKDEYKGDFARAYFYMATCYGKDINGNFDPTICSQYQGWRTNNSDVGSKFAMQNDNYLEFQPWEQEVLIAWHRQDPVSVKEIKRADAVSNFQHNRNPFIDYPYLAEYIWGEHAGETLDMSKLMASTDPDFIPGESDGSREGTPVGPSVVKYGVSWSVNGEVMKVDSVVENKKLTALPATPVSCSAESNVFMGWTDAPIDGTADEAPAILYTAVAQFPAVTEDVIYYAVFAHAGEGASEPAVYTYSADSHADGWNNTGTNKGSYWLLDSGKELISPEVDLAGLSSIQAKLRTFGGTQYDKFSFAAGNTQIGTITVSEGSTMTEYEWTNTKSLSGKSRITFTCSNAGSGKGVGFSYVTINATGAGVTYDRFITSCQTPTEVELVGVSEQARKLLIGGQIYILLDNQLFNLQGQRVK